MYLIEHALQRQNDLAGGQLSITEKTFSANRGRYVEAEDSNIWGYGPEYRHCGQTAHSFLKSMRRLTIEGWEEDLEWGMETAPPARIALFAWEPI